MNIDFKIFSISHSVDFIAENILVVIFNSRLIRVTALVMCKYSSWFLHREVLSSGSH